MKFEYTGRHIEVTEPIRNHVEEHFDRIDHLFEGNGDHVHIIIEVEKGQHRSEIVLKTRSQVFTANSTDEDMYQSLSHSIDKIEKQVLRLKNKSIDRTHSAEKLGRLTAVEE
ncbi:MAG: ribosome hibernation-promoting factor, HPF/YfiA family [Pyrinomonadaceae bacterium]